MERSQQTSLRQLLEKYLNVLSGKKENFINVLRDPPDERPSEKEFIESEIASVSKTIDTILTQAYSRDRALSVFARMLDEPLGSLEPGVEGLRRKIDRDGLKEQIQKKLDETAESAQRELKETIESYRYRLKLLQDEYFQHLGEAEKIYLEEVEALGPQGRPPRLPETGWIMERLPSSEKPLGQAGSDLLPAMKYYARCRKIRHGYEKKKESLLAEVWSREKNKISSEWRELEELIGVQAQKISRLEERLRKDMSRSSELSARQKGWSGECLKLETALEESRCKIAELEAALSRSSVRMQMAQEQCQVLAERDEGQTASIQALKKEIRERENRIKELENSFVYEKKSLEKEEEDKKRLASMKAALEEKNREWVAAKEAVTRLEAFFQQEIRRLQASLEERNRELLAAKEAAAKFKTSSEAEHEGRKKDVAAIRDTCRSFQQEIERLKGLLSAKTLEIEKINTQVASQMGEQNKKIDEYRRAAQEAAERASSWEKRCEDLKAAPELPPVAEVEVPPGIRRRVPAYMWAAVPVLLLFIAGAWSVQKHERSYRRYALPYESSQGFSLRNGRMYSVDISRMLLYSISPEDGSVLSVHPIPNKSLTGIAAGADSVWTSDADSGHVFKLDSMPPYLIRKVYQASDFSPARIYYDGNFLWSADLKKATLMKLRPEEELRVMAQYHIPDAAPSGFSIYDKRVWVLDQASLVLTAYRLGKTLEATESWDLSWYFDADSKITGFALDAQSVWIQTADSAVIHRIDFKTLNTIAGKAGRALSRMLGLGRGDILEKS